MNDSGFQFIVYGEPFLEFCQLQDSDSPLYRRQMGGGAAAVACACSRLGCKTAFYGRTGDDAFSIVLREALNAEGINTENLKDSTKPFSNTSLLFTEPHPYKNARLYSYRKGDVDENTSPEEFDLTTISRSECFCFSAASSGKSFQKTGFALAQYAREQKRITAFSPNLCPGLLEGTREYCYQAFALADIIKMSLNELVFIMNEADPDKAAARLMLQFHPKILLVTMGQEGCFIRSVYGDLRLPGFVVEAVDSSAAGDAFAGAFLSRLVSIGKPLTEFNIGDVAACAVFANAAGALTASKPGAISALPFLDETEAFLRKYLM